MKSVSVQETAASGTPGIRGFLGKSVFHVVFIVLVGLIVYSNTFHVPFLFDDISSITNNPVIRDLEGFLSGAGYAYNPRRFIGYLSIALNYRLGGGDVTGYHIFNLAVHLTTACLVYLLVRLTLRTPFFESAECGVRSAEFKTRNSKLETRNFLPLLAALLFVAHPVQTQAVSYIIQRLASLATMFYLLSLVLYIKSRLSADSSAEQTETRNSKLKTPFPPSSGKTVPLLYYLGSLLAAVLAMKTKEIAFTLPLVTALYEMCFFRGKAGRRLLVLLPMLLTLLIVPLSLMEGGRPAGELLSDLNEKARADMMVPRWDYLMTQFRVILTYLRLLILPVNQNLDYDYTVYTSFLQPPVFLSILFLLALIGLAVYLFYQSKCGVRSADLRPPKDYGPQAECGMQNHGSWKGGNSEFRIPNSELRLIAFGILWFFITLSVESSVIPVADVIYEHRLYLPSVGIFVAAAAVLASFYGRLTAKACIAAFALLVLLLSAVAWKRNIVWGSAISLWRDNVEKSPGKSRPHDNLGHALLAKGRVDEAIMEFRAALAIRPGFANAHNNLGVAYLEKGLIDSGIEEFRAAAAIKPEFADAYYNLGDAFSAKGEMDKAIENYLIAVKLRPAFSQAYNNLGIAYARGGVLDKAIENFKVALRLSPDDASAYNNLARAMDMLSK